MRVIGLAVVVGLGLTLTPIVSEAQKPWQEFNDHGAAYATLAGDVLALTKGHLSPLDILVGNTLIEVAGEAQGMCLSAGELSPMRALVSPEQDRVNQYFRGALEDRAKRIDGLVDKVNQGIAQTKSAGMAATGIHLRDQLRSSKALLEKWSRPPQ